MEVLLRSPLLLGEVMPIVLRSLLLAFVTLAGANAYAEIMVFGPTPYQSASDSPFADLIGKPGFYLEDFEDGELNTPGVTQPLDPSTHGAILEEAATDDTNHILESRFYAFRPTDPPISTSYLRFSFNSLDIKETPNIFGFAWSGGPEESIVRLRTFDENFVLDHEVSCALPQCSTCNDTPRFLGILLDDDFNFIEIAVTYVGSPASFRIDDLQYGTRTPEPITNLLLLTLLPTITNLRLRK